MRLSYVIAVLAALGLLAVQVSNAVNVHQNYPPLELDYSDGYNPLTKFFKLDTGSGEWKSSVSPNRLTDSSSSSWIVWSLRRREGGQQSVDGHAILKTAGATAQTTDHNGIVIHGDCDYSFGSSSNKFRVIFFRGDANITVWETTGADLPGISFDVAPCSNCVGSGAVIGGNDHIGFQWEGVGDNLVIRTWNFQAAVPSDPTDWTTWGNCHNGIYDQAASPACNGGAAPNNFQADFDNTAYDSGTCVGIMHHDAAAANGAGSQWVYFSE